MTQPTPRQRIENLWDRATPIGPLLDAYRDDIAIDIGRDALRDGLQPFLTRLVGKANTQRLLDERRAAARCSSCEHGLDIHDTDGRCWFTVQQGVPDRDLVCSCKLRQMAEEARS